MIQQKNLRTLLVVLLIGIITVIDIVALNGCSSINNFLTAENVTQQETAATTATGVSDGPAASPGDGSANGNETASGQTTETGGGSSGGMSTDGTSGGSSDTEPSEIQVTGDVKPDESGKVIVLMFHNFISSYSGGDKEWTTTFDDFRLLLQNLYDMGYRLVNLIDYVKGDIDVPEGKIPIVFTFDDGTCGQFCLQETDGILKVKKNSAVGVMEEFAESHPDFGLKGTFFVNLGDSAFPGAGTLQQRLQYLIDKGFEIGNHTYMHTNLKTVTTAEKMQSEVGANNNMMLDLISGYSMETISLPYGEPSKSMAGYVVKGVFEGIEYENLAVLKVGWDPNPSPFNVEFDPLDVHRVRSSGLISVDGDFDWWMAKLTIAEQYVSDGNPDTVTIPAAKQDAISGERINDRQLLIY